MLHIFRNRLAICLLAVAYLTAGAAGNLLHRHVHNNLAHGDTAGKICQHVHDHDEHGEHQHSVPDDGLALVAAVADHHDDCTICRAAGQRVVPAAIAQLVELRGFVEPLRVVQTNEPITASARTQHSRAPPRAS
jgi:hypothetical protein